MRIKTFEAPTLQDALGRAKDELGEEALVLNTRQVKSSRLIGLRSSSKVEVTAAADEKAESRELRVESPNPRPSAPNCQPPTPNPHSEIADLRWELQRLGVIVESLLGPRTATERMGPIGQTGQVGHIGPMLSTLGIDENLLRGPLSDLRGIDDTEALASALAGKLQPFACPPQTDRPANPLPDGRSATVIALVGPTGVGKTTTLAKLAARYSIEQGKSVALVTIDTFRIGAVEQLRTYARIMGMPLEVALSPDDVRAGLAKHRDKDLVLIDTVGRSQRSDEHLGELRTFLDAADGAEPHLVVSASLARETQDEVVDRFAMFSPVRLIVTKLDECPNRGILVNLPLATGLGISCVTAGQNVPQDLEFAEAGLLARLVVGPSASKGLSVAREGVAA
jgi:flagellar biosynthesis protein FlhF